MIPKLGVCYYPEHWDRAIWEDDAKRMVELGLSYVRIGEFAWSRMEPSEGTFDWGWLDEAVEVLGRAGLNVVMGTPTATPPKWVVEKYPDMLAVDAEGRTRKYGSRRHYCFSHEGYKAEAARITRQMGERYGKNPHIVAWQIDNEYGCHDTTISYSNAARTAFRDWLGQKYQSPSELNRAWGNIFWSMEVSEISQIELPNLTVTEPNPAHLMDFRRFTSNQVVRWNKTMVEALRMHTDAPLSHNYMGRITDFDHFDVGADLEIASWDSYPLGFLEDRIPADEDFKSRFSQQGHPDFQAFHHDLYRAVGTGRWWIMEQQPGPVNWAPYNPAPLEGMVRLWTMEAVAHGAEVVSFFRWRQAPFAQEQMHSGLNRHDGRPALAWAEVEAAAKDLSALGELKQLQAPVALLFDYPSQWAWEIQPQGQGFDYFQLLFEFYSSLRSMGVDVDILNARDAKLDGYELVIVPGLFSFAHLDWKHFDQFEGHILWGPRAGSKTDDFSLTKELPPGLRDFDVAVTRVETLRPNTPRPLRGGGEARLWVESLEIGEVETLLETSDGAPISVRSKKDSYLGAWLDPVALKRLLVLELDSLDIPTIDLPEVIRVRKIDGKRFVFNYGAQELEFQGQSIPAASYLII